MRGCGKVGHSEVSGFGCSSCFGKEEKGDNGSKQGGERGRKGLAVTCECRPLQERTVERKPCGLSAVAGVNCLNRTFWSEITVIEHCRGLCPPPLQLEGRHRVGEEGKTLKSVTFSCKANAECHWIPISVAFIQNDVSYSGRELFLYWKMRSCIFDIA